MYLALAGLTTSCSASIVSSMGSVIPAMDLVEVHVIRPQPLQTLSITQDRLADCPAPFGPSCILPCTLAAITTSSRLAKSFKARPRISSLVPME
jgi:hypothetical protein